MRKYYILPVNTELAADEENFFLIRTDKKKKYILNESIYELLVEFQEPITKEEAIQKFLKKNGVDDEVLKRKLKKLIRQLRKVKFIRNAHRESSTKDNEAEEKVMSNENYREVIKVHDTKNSKVYMVLTSEGESRIVKVLSFWKKRFEKKIRNEVEILRHLEDTGVVPKVISFSEKNLTVELEYLKGRDLTTLLRANCLSKEEKFTLIRNILEVYTLIHSKKVLHADIHSKNIFVGENFEIYLVDFGNSMNMLDDKYYELWFVGLSFFIPPERISEDCFDKFTIEPDERSEVYQIGLIMQLIIYGELPFKGGTWKKLVHSIQNWNEELPESECATKEIKSVILKSMKKDPDERFQTMAEMLEAFKNITLN